MYTIPFEVVEWRDIPKTVHAGETGEAWWQTWQQQGLRVRLVEYLPNYRADHWCEKGHLLFVLEGEMVTELSDGSRFVMKAGTSYQVSDHLSKHQSHTTTGARLLIIDGTFLTHTK
jgi:quercetin dioxygenase-like cupin family protein